MQKKKILCFEPTVDPLLAAAGYEVVHSAKDHASILACVPECEAILIRTELIDAAILQAAPKLKIVARFGMGYDNVDVETATNLGIWVTNVPAGNVESVAEGAIYLRQHRTNSV